MQSRLPLNTSTFLDFIFLQWLDVWSSKLFHFLIRLSTLSGLLIYPAKGLKDNKPVFRAMEMICFNMIIYPHTVLVRHFFSSRRKYSKSFINVRFNSLSGISSRW